MKKLIIGALVLLIGVPAFSFTFFKFLHFLAGLLPVFMILGGAIAIYLGITELKQADNTEATFDPPERQPNHRTEKNALNSEEKSKPVLNDQDITPVLDPMETPDENSADEPDEQPESDIAQESETDATLSRNPADALTPEAGAPAGEQVNFKGNIETLVFHEVTCNFANGKNCSMDFITKQEAETQGYKPCKICMPEA